MACLQTTLSGLLSHSHSCGIAGGDHELSEDSWSDFLDAWFSQRTPWARRSNRLRPVSLTSFEEQLLPSSQPPDAYVPGRDDVLGHLEPQAPSVPDSWQENFMTGNGMEARSMKHWRCVPMKELNKRGPEIASLRGNVVVQPQQLPDGSEGWRAAHSKPPGFTELPPPPGKICTKRYPCEDMPDVRLLDDGRGSMFWVTLRPTGKDSHDRQVGDIPEELPDKEEGNSALRDKYALQDLQYLTGRRGGGGGGGGGAGPLKAAELLKELKGSGFDNPQLANDRHTRPPPEGNEDLYHPSLMKSLEERPWNVVCSKPPDAASFKRSLGGNASGKNLFVMHEFLG